MNKETIEKIRQEAQNTKNDLSGYVFTMPIYKSVKDWWFKTYSNIFLTQYLIEKLETLIGEEQTQRFITTHSKMALALAYGLNENASDYQIEQMQNAPDFDNLPTLNDKSTTISLGKKGVKKITHKHKPNID